MHHHFREGKGVEDDESCGCPLTFRSNENINKFSVEVHANGQQTIFQAAESFEIPEATYQRIRTKDLNMHRVCQHMTSRIFNEDQKTIKMEMAGDLIWAFDKNPSLLGRIVTADKKWCLLFDPHSKRHRLRENHHNLQRSRNSAKISVKERSCWKYSSISRKLYIWNLSLKGAL